MTLCHAIEKVNFVRYVIKLLFLGVVFTIGELRKYSCILVTKIENGAIIWFDTFILYGVSLRPFVKINLELEYVTSE